MRRAVALLIMLGGVIGATLFVAPAPAQAVLVPRTVWVEVHANAAWPVARAVTYVDRYTGTRMVLGRCRSGQKCIVITESSALPSYWAAATYPGYPRTQIKLNPSRRSVSSDQRYHILVHELGHANGIYTHTSSCTSIMYSRVHCSSGRLAPITFTSTQRRTLSAN